MNDRNHLKLLLADDDKPIANIYRTGLPQFFAEETSRGRMSASITVCSQGDAAVALFQEAHDKGEPFDVIVLDVRMPPGISGVEAAENIRGVDKDVPIIFISGYSDVAIPNLEERVPPASKMCYVEKPIQLSELADLIVEMSTA